MEKNPNLPSRSGKPTLSDALRAIAEIIEIAAEGENAEEQVQSVLEFATNQLADCCERRINFVRVLSGGSLSVDSKEGLIGEAYKREEDAKKHRMMLQKILQRVKDDTRFNMQANEIKKLQGKSGYFLLSEASPALECDVPLYNKSYSNLIRGEVAAHFEIPSEFLIYEQICTFNKEFLKEEIKKGAVFPWARLKWSDQIRLKI